MEAVNLKKLICTIIAIMLMSAMLQGCGSNFDTVKTEAVLLASPYVIVGITLSPLLCQYAPTQRLCATLSSCLQ